MRITYWNIRGCNNTLKICLLRRKIELENMGVIFLQETKCLEMKLKSIGGKVWKGCEAIAVDAKKAAGGIGILWNQCLRPSSGRVENSISGLPKDD